MDKREENPNYIEKQKELENRFNDDRKMQEESIQQNMDNMTNSISKISFLFLVYAVIAGGYVTQVLPCQTQFFLENSIFAKHFIGVLLIFCFIMMEGGWDFDMKENDKAPVDWASGNTFHTMVWGIMLYVIFLLTSKMQLVSNLLFFGLLFLVYLINTYRIYLKNRDNITDASNENMLLITKILIVLSGLTFLFGVVDYYRYQKISYGRKFTLMKFLLGANKCGSLL